MTTKDFNTATLTAKLFFANRVDTSTGTGTTVYTVPASRCAKLQTLTLTSTSASPVTVDVYVVPSATATNDQHKIVAEYVLPAKDSLSLSSYIAGMMLGEGDYIRVKASVTNVVNVILTGVEGS